MDYLSNPKSNQAWALQGKICLGEDDIEVSTSLVGMTVNYTSHIDAELGLPN